MITMLKVCDMLTKVCDMLTETSHLELYES